jgi:multidrug efflux pump subunit AcrB
VARESGLAGRLAAVFIASKLTPLAVGASILLGLGAVVLLPREEEPQIVVPMIDVLVEMPGASPSEVEQRVTRPMEKLLWEIPGVEYIYSTSSPGFALAVVRYRVGEDEEDAIVRLNQKLMANFDIIPPGASQPIVKPRSIDDVPILALTLWSERYDGATLRRIAAQAHDAIKEVPDVAEVRLIGGQRRQVRVILDDAKLAAVGLSPAAVVTVLAQANSRSHSGAFATNNREYLVETGNLLEDADEVGGVVVGTAVGATAGDAARGRPVHLRDVAVISDGPEEPRDYVWHGNGPAAATSHVRGRGGESRRGSYPSVTISVAKRKATNATVVAEQVLEKVQGLQGTVIPSDVYVNVSRNYGETAKEKSDELLFHMLLAILSVTALIWFALGRHESGIVAIAIPVTLALTLLVFYLYGYTLNRVTLFALIFSIGILVDDAIVVVENIVRHRRLGANAGRPLLEVAIEAVDEVGNPTILATFAVVAAILPMAFVRGLMGPYMRPIPVGATAAMLFSLLVAFVVTPWASAKLLQRQQKGAGEHDREDWSTRAYRRWMMPLITKRRWRTGFLAGVAVLLLVACSLVALKLVKVKMLPFDNKSEFQVVIDMPEGATLEQTYAATQAIADYLGTVPEVADYQSYVGTSAPYNFNGLVRHYFMRQGPNVADIQVNLAGKDDRDAQSHDIAKRVRPDVDAIGRRFGARVKVAEVPPGPPVLQTLVAEIYGPSAEQREYLARQVLDIFESTPGVVDVDWYVEDDQTRYRFEVDRAKAALHGVSTEQIGAAMRVALGGQVAGLLHQPGEKEDVAILVRLGREQRSSLEDLKGTKVMGSTGALVPLGELVRIEETTADRSIYHKNLMPVTYVTGDVAGEAESPVYAILAINEAIDRLRAPEGYAIDKYTATQPFSGDRLSMKWDGEWHITYEVFRDLGIAFAAVLVLIYVLVVGWFHSLKTPFVIMAAIPFSLVGILPAHWAMGAFFTATSMIGFIAGAGIVVRNSIILVDFIELRLREGMPLAEAVVDAGAVRFRPMLLTAAAVVVGASVILFDPIFQGLAISLMAGEVASLLLSRLAVPVLYYLSERRSYPASSPAPANDGEADEEGGAGPAESASPVASRQL